MIRVNFTLVETLAAKITYHKIPIVSIGVCQDVSKVFIRLFLRHASSKPRKRFCRFRVLFNNLFLYAIRVLGAALVARTLDSF